MCYNLDCKEHTHTHIIKEINNMENKKNPIFFNIAILVFSTIIAGVLSASLFLALFYGLVYIGVIPL